MGIGRVLTYGMSFGNNLGEFKPNGNPSALILTVLSDTSIKCDWTNGATNQDGTYVYTSLDGVTNWTLSGTAFGSLTTKTLTGLVQNTTYYIRVVHYKGAKLSSYSNIANDWTLPNFVFAPVIEDRARLANRTYTFTGTTRTVGSGKTYATISAAYAASSAGDVIEVYNSLDMKDEAGGYLLLNTAAKRILIKGMGLASSDTVLSQTGASTFCVRKRDTVEAVFENLKITSNKDAATFYNDTDGDNAISIFKNVILENTNTGASATAYSYTDSFGTRNRWIEFKDSFISSAAANLAAVGLYSNQGANTQYLFTNCTMLGGKANIANNYLAKISAYDCTFTQIANRPYGLYFGTDTTVPANNTGYFDIRGCNVVFTEAAVGHGVLFGRGTTNYYFVNNQITLQPINNALSIGLVLKSTGTSSTDMVIQGNKVIAPRPYYNKGGSYITTTTNNILISNESNWFGYEIDNPVYSVGDEMLSRNNTFTNNIIYGTISVIKLYATTAAESAKDSAKTGLIDSNTYCTTVGKYLLNDATITEWADKSTFWGNSFDANSKYKSGVPSPV